VRIHVAGDFSGDIEGTGVAEFRPSRLGDRRSRWLGGDGGFTAELGQGADITLDYWFEEGGRSGPGAGLTTTLVIAKLEAS
jgi:hypothetical protein